MLVAKLVNTFTNPDTIYVQQRDSPEFNINRKSNDEDDGDDNLVLKVEPYMYFIRAGRYTVHVKDQFITKRQFATVDSENQEDDKNKDKCGELFEGDHFGEIGLIYGTKRTATIRSENYGTIALLSKSAYNDMLKSFDSMANFFKQHMFKYSDKLLNFLEFEMDKIDYFRELQPITKQEIIFNMDQETFEQGSMLVENGQLAEKMYLIQDGIVEIAIKYDARVEDGSFVIERLTKGAIINHRSFLLKDDADTDFRCLTTVSVFSLSYAKMKEIIKRRSDMRNAKVAVRNEVFQSSLPLALDYVIHNSEALSPEAYHQKLYENDARVKFKNAVMQTWSEIKSK